MQYIDFRQTNLVSFNVTQCLQVFEDCLHVLRKSALVATDYNGNLKKMTTNYFIELKKKIL